MGETRQPPQSTLTLGAYILGFACRYGMLPVRLNYVIPRVSLSDDHVLPWW